MSERTLTIIIRVLFICMVVGMLGMIQPFSLSLFKPGFQLLLYAVLAYIVFSHITPKSDQQREIE